MHLDLTQLHRRSVLMAAAYEPWERCEAIVSAQGYGSFESYDESDVGGTQAYVAASDNEILFCFAGSNDLVDFVRDIKCIGRVPFMGNRLNGHVHRGFNEAFSRAGFEVAQRVKRLLEDKPRPVVGVGHSLGSAVAAMTAFAYLSDPTLYLFGCPRIGDSVFAEEFNDILGDNTYSLRNRSDIVTLSPFWNHDIGQQFYMARNRLIYWPGMLLRMWERLKATCAWAFDYFTAKSTIPRSITDHFSSNYVAKAKSLMEVA